ncbi:hypothetical protein PAXRUDRAFT_11312 [Paxillus rubicundulus Ve08.2h10]|uniref:Uncharacterized protein n=1 Tax=Paxillus rubicundulus Ve08.2h10 TaxID=930991 RepID=A0A0D0E3T6_9AGAM|nr:hypothetical protein PAXRUDRAFT_11312 [Paxillus rubicundulus Ve08.2h10]
MKAQKEVEHWIVEEVARRKAEEVVKQKAEVEAQRRAEAEAKACAEEVARAQSSVLGPSKGKQPKAAARKKKARMQSPVADKDDDEKYEEEAEDEEAEEEPVTETQDMATDRRHAAAESHAQTEQMLGILEEIQGCLDLEFTLEEPEVGSEEGFEEGEVAEVAEEREALKGRSEEKVEVDESV